MSRSTTHANSTDPGSLPTPQDGAFPWRLHDLLEAADAKGFDDIISWLPDSNKSFQVHDIKAFEANIIPKYMSSMSKYKSFIRQLNLYCFERQTQGPDRGSYSHPLFVRDKKHLCNTMSLTKFKGGPKRGGSAPSPRTKKSQGQCQRKGAAARTGTGTPASKNAKAKSSTSAITTASTRRKKQVKRRTKSAQLRMAKKGHRASLASPSAQLSKRTAVTKTRTAKSTKKGRRRTDKPIDAADAADTKAIIVVSPDQSPSTERWVTKEGGDMMRRISIVSLGPAIEQHHYARSLREATYLPAIEPYICPSFLSDASDHSDTVPDEGIERIQAILGSCEDTLYLNFDQVAEDHDSEFQQQQQQPQRRQEDWLASPFDSACVATTSPNSSLSSEIISPTYVEDVTADAAPVSSYEEVCNTHGSELSDSDLLIEDVGAEIEAAIAKSTFFEGRPFFLVDQEQGKGQIRAVEV